MTFGRNFWTEEQGQDLIEYSLLVAFVAMASAALFSSSSGSIASIWAKTQRGLDKADKGIN
jgi:Flp pilus assembly pilin Flp